MTFFTDILKGIMIGIANIIPGVSGGTMAVSLGIYDKLIGSVSNLLKDWRSSVRTLLPLLIGCGIGIVGFTYAIEYLLSHHTFVTCMAFVGLILGGLPVLFQALRKELRTQKKSIGISGAVAFILFFAICAFLPMLKNNQDVLTSFAVTPMTIILSRRHRLRHHGYPRCQRLHGHDDPGLLLCRHQHHQGLLRFLKGF